MFTKLTSALALLCLAATPAPLAAQGCPTITPSLDWQNTIQHPDDPFRVYGTAFGEPSWVKFAILECNGLPVYYQNGNQFLFHYEFATQRLDPFFGMSLAQFNAATLFNTGRQALLGAVVLPQPFGVNQAEYGIQLVSSDVLSLQDVIDHFNAVKSSVNALPGVQAFYFPTFEQLDFALANEAALNLAVIQISSPARWSTGNSVYSNGWALGRLNFVPAANIDAEFAAGTLLPSDILLTDGVPADIPLLAGIISLAPATPSSHIAILASTFGVPFCYLGDPDDAAAAPLLDGHLVGLNAFSGEALFGFGPAVELIDAEGQLSQQQQDEILALKAPAPLNIARVANLGAYTLPTDGLVQADIQYFGGKAANFGFLRRSIPANSPVSLGISFDLWEEFLSQTMASGMTLRQEIDAILAPYTTFPLPSPQALFDDLDIIQDKFKSTADTAFTTAQMNAILAALQDTQYGFDPAKKIRFRSSTNVEDSEQFTGAGLYDSKSGCLSDELDADTVGPSICDPTDADERGVFRAIRRVFASFYRDNAFLERLRHGVDEHDVGMAILAHHSFPDEIELANGVGTVDMTGFYPEIQLVTQLGAVSVTNPDGSAIPEVVSIFAFNPPNLFPSLEQTSSLVQLGATVMDMPSDYVELGNLLLAVSAQFELETGKTDYVLDFEYKKVAPTGQLVVKQVREIPQPSSTPSIAPFLINQPTEYVVMQGHAGDVFSNHRLKSTWNVETENLWLEQPALGALPIFANIDVDWFDGCETQNYVGLLSGLPLFTHSYDDEVTTTSDVWSELGLFNRRFYELRTPNVGGLVSPAQTPLLTIERLGRQLIDPVLELGCDFALPVQNVTAIWPNPSAPSTTKRADVFLIPRITDLSNDTYRSHVIDAGGGVTIEPSYWLHPQGGLCAGCIFPLSAWDQTVISGLTTTPLVLTGEYSQSYEAGQHNFTETFLFEPALEPGVTQQQLDELAAQGIAMIWAQGGISPFEALFLGPDPCEPVCSSVNYCEAAPNSTGSGATISARGTTSVSANNFGLAVSGAPAGTPGLFYYGPATLHIPFGNGYRCIGGGPNGVFRLFPPVFTDGSGDASRFIDLLAPPANAGPGQISPGDTWNFQYWYRDPAAGGAGFNLTDGVSANFCP